MSLQMIKQVKLTWVKVDWNKLGRTFLFFYFFC